MIVQYTMKTNLWRDDFETRFAEINQIRSWLDEQTEWQPDRYTITNHSSGQKLAVWFDRDEDAVMFILRWT
jgi:hypothetical protein